MESIAVENIFRIRSHTCTHLLTQSSHSTDHHIHWMLDHSCVHDAGTGSTTDWDYERWQWAAVQVQRNIASGLRPPPPRGPAKRGLARNRRLQSTAKWARLPIIGTYSYVGTDVRLWTLFYWQISLGAHPVFEGYWIFIKYSVFKYCFLLKSHLWLIHNV